MSTEVLLAEIAAAICDYEGTSDPSYACVLGIEAVTRERWRVWCQLCSTPSILLFLVTLRSNTDGIVWVENLFIASCSECPKVIPISEAEKPLHVARPSVRPVRKAGVTFMISGMRGSAAPPASAVFASPHAWKRSATVSPPFTKRP